MKAKPGARVLLEHPLLSVAGQNAPVLVVADEERGRSMALMTDSSWFWSFPAEGRGLSNRYYEHFWNNAIRWLVRDPDLTQVKVEPERRTVEPGQPVALVVKARQADYGPAAGAQITRAAARRRDRQAGGASARGGRAPTAAPGSSCPACRLAPTGRWRAPTSTGEELGKAEDALAVRQSGPETDDPLPRPELLRAIAEATGGSYSELPRTLPPLHALDPEVVEIGRRKDRPIWDNGWPLLLLCLTHGRRVVAASPLGLLRFDRTGIAA